MEGQLDVDTHTKAGLRRTSNCMLHSNTRYQGKLLAERGRAVVAVSSHKKERNRKEREESSKSQTQIDRENPRRHLSDRQGSTRAKEYDERPVWMPAPSKKKKREAKRGMNRSTGRAPRSSGNKPTKTPKKQNEKRKRGGRNEAVRN